MAKGEKNSWNDGKSGYMNKKKNGPAVGNTSGNALKNNGITGKR